MRLGSTLYQRSDQTNKPLPGSRPFKISVFLPIKVDRRHFMFSLCLSLSSSACPDLTPYHHGKNFTLALAPQEWQYFYASHPKENKPFRLWVSSSKPVRLAAETIPSCPNETTLPFLETEGGNRWIEGQCTLRTPNRVLAVGVYSEVSQIVQVKLPSNDRMSFGKRKALELGLSFLALVAIAVAFFCCYVLPEPKRKRE
jgi:hypothetical protein